MEEAVMATKREKRKRENWMEERGIEKKRRGRESVLEKERVG